MYITFVGKKKILIKSLVLFNFKNKKEYLSILCDWSRMMNERQSPCTASASKHTQKGGQGNNGGRNGIAVVMETSRKGAALIAYVGIDLSVSA